jgi:hypothetical protein
MADGMAIRSKQTCLGMNIPFPESKGVWQTGGGKKDDWYGTYRLVRDH